MLEYALTRCLEIIGEAATRLSRESLESMPEIPWREVIGMRNRLIHAYASVDRNFLWETVRSDIPPLLDKVILALAEGGSGPLPK